MSRYVEWSVPTNGIATSQFGPKADIDGATDDVRKDCQSDQRPRPRS